MATAKLDSESFHLTARLFERARAVNSLGGVPKFLFDGKLGDDAAAGFGFTEAACAEALELLLGLAPDHDKAVELLMNSGFDQQGGFHEGGVARALALPFVKLAENDFGDARVHDGVKAVEFRAVSESHRCELGAVDTPTRVHDGRSEFAENFIVGGLAGLDEFVGEGIGIEDGKTHVPQHGRDGALAAGDPARESKS